MQTQYFSSTPSTPFDVSEKGHVGEFDSLLSHISKTKLTEQFSVEDQVAAAGKEPEAMAEVMATVGKHYEQKFALKTTGMPMSEKSQKQYLQMVEEKGNDEMYFAGNLYHLLGGDRFRELLELVKNAKEYKSGVVKFTVQQPRKAEDQSDNNTAPKKQKKDPWNVQKKVSPKQFLSFLATRLLPANMEVKAYYSGLVEVDDLPGDPGKITPEFIANNFKRLCKIRGYELQNSYRMGKLYQAAFDLHTKGIFCPNFKEWENVCAEVFGLSDQTVLNYRNLARFLDDYPLMRKVTGVNTSDIIRQIPGMRKALEESSSEESKKMRLWWQNLEQQPL